MTAFAEKMPPLEQAPRRALLWGAGLLVLGLAAVGVGQQDEGAVLALVGLLVTLFGIHSFGRLGPDDAAETTRREATAAAGGRDAAVSAMWTGGLTLAVGLVITVGSYFEASSGAGKGSYLLAYGAILGGAIRLLNGWLHREKVKRGEAKVEKRRRLGKSHAP